MIKSLDIEKMRTLLSTLNWLTNVFLMFLHTFHLRNDFYLHRLFAFLGFFSRFSEISPEIAKNRFIRIDLIFATNRVFSLCIHYLDLKIDW